MTPSAAPRPLPAGPQTRTPSTTPHAPTTPAPAATPAAAPASSSLDPLETSAHEVSQPQCSCGSPACDLEQEFRHSGWHRQRQATWEALKSLASAARVAAFEACGQGASVWVSTSPMCEEPEYVIQARYCHDRFCVPCATSRSYVAMRKIQSLVELHPRTLRFVTLTLKHRAGESLRAQLDRLYAGFSDLRRLSFWQHTVTGGVAVCEVKRSSSSSWHAHLHLLVDGQFIDQQRLSRAWRGVTGDSYIVDVRAVSDAADAVRYVAKYAAKPMDSGFWHDRDLLQQAILALSRRRLFTAFGTWYGHDDELNADHFDIRTDPRDFRPMCSLSTLFARAAQGDAHATMILVWLRVRDPLTGDRLTLGKDSS